MQLPALSPEQAAALAKNKETPAYKFFVEHADVPSVLRNKTPNEPASRVVQWLDRNVFDKVGLASVWVNHAQMDGKDYYRLSIKTPLRKVTLVVTPFGAYYFSLGLAYLAQAGHLNSGVDVLFADDQIGDVLIPSWAFAGVVKELCAITSQHEEKVRFLVNEMHRLGEPAEEELKEPAKPAARTLH